MSEKGKKLEEKLDRFAQALERSNISDYIQLIQKPFRMIGVNLLAGIARGLGIAIGMTLVAAIVVIILTKVLSQLITLPIIGEQIAQIVALVNKYLTEGSQLKIK